MENLKTRIVRYQNGIGRTYEDVYNNDIQYVLHVYVHLRNTEAFRYTKRLSDFIDFIRMINNIEIPKPKKKSHKKMINGEIQYVRKEKRNKVLKELDITIFANVENVADLFNC